MKKVVYYETDSSSPSTSGSDAASVTSKHHERKKFSKTPLCYPHISKHAPLLSIPLGKPPVFYGEDYCMWSDKMRHHLTSLHASIWDIVEFGVHVPSVGDEGYDSDEVAQIQHFNSQDTSTTRRWRSSSRAFAKSSSKGRGKTTSPVPKGCATNVVSPVTI
jgi:hypothetical protein